LDYATIGGRTNSYVALCMDCVRWRAR